MPIDDWTKVDSGILHAFHHEWISQSTRRFLRLTRVAPGRMTSATRHLPLATFHSAPIWLRFRRAGLLALVFAGSLSSLALAAGESQKGTPGPPERSAKSSPRYDFVERRIQVDGDAEDWRGVAANHVRGREHLWFGQGMTPEKWHGDKDLSYTWRGAWFGEKLYFLFEVADDKVLEPSQAASYLCDCVEIYLDPRNQGGQRVKIGDGRKDWFAKCDPAELMGYELHFLPTSPPRVYLDHTDKYAVDKPQNERFVGGWSGEAAFKKTPAGYLLEIGFCVPGLRPRPGLILGVETGVCDDDGDGRKSILIWTGTKADFWVTMDEYGKVRLVGRSASENGSSDEFRALHMCPLPHPYIHSCQQTLSGGGEGRVRGEMKAER